MLKILSFEGKENTLDHIIIKVSSPHPAVSSANGFRSGSLVEEFSTKYLVFFKQSKNLSSLCVFPNDRDGFNLLASNYLLAFFVVIITSIGSQMFNILLHLIFHTVRACFVFSIENWNSR